MLCFWCYAVVVLDSSLQLMPFRVQRLEELQRFAESQAYVSQMQLAASCWLVVYLFAIEFWDACNAHDTSDTYYDIIIMTIVILVKS